MSLGIVYDGLTSLEEFLPFLREAEGMGIESVWVAEHFGYRDAFVISSALMKETKTLKIVPGPISPYTRHPMAIAMAVASLRELDPNRIELVIGTGDIYAQRKLGIEVKKPLGTTAESIKTIRMLLEGDRVKYKGKRFEIEEASINFPTQKVPIFQAAVGPKMIENAGKYADGLVLSAAISQRDIERSLLRVQLAVESSGEPDRPFRRIAWYFASAAQDRETAYGYAKHRLSYLLQDPTPTSDLELNELDINYTAIRSAIEAKDWEKASSLVDDEVIELITVSGSPTGFKDRLKSFIDAGIDYPVLWCLGPLEAQRMALELALDVCANQA
jgi:5,10-methylenetetrahydromethanopterin reductase